MYADLKVDFTSDFVSVVSVALELDIIQPLASIA
jgi:hypothetical protein